MAGFLSGLTPGGVKHDVERDLRFDLDKVALAGFLSGLTRGGVKHDVKRDFGVPIGQYKHMLITESGRFTKNNSKTLFLRSSHVTQTHDNNNTLFSTNT